MGVQVSVVDNLSMVLILQPKTKIGRTSWIMEWND